MVPPRSSENLSIVTSRNVFFYKSVYVKRLSQSHVYIVTIPKLQTLSHHENLLIQYKE